MVPIGVAKDFFEINELQKESDLNDIKSVLSSTESDEQVC